MMLLTKPAFWDVLVPVCSVHKLSLTLQGQQNPYAHQGLLTP
jgi:hypothetical protein